MSADTFTMADGSGSPVNISSKGIHTSSISPHSWPQALHGLRIRERNSRTPLVRSKVRAESASLTPSDTLSVTGSLDDAVAGAYDSIDQGLRILPPSLFPDFLEDERFIVWMRVAGCVIHLLFIRRLSVLIDALHLLLFIAANARSLPTFRKLWGIIDRDLAAGTYTIVVTSRTSSSASLISPSRISYSIP